MAMDQTWGRATQDERSHVSKPQVFVQLQFGVSWSERHAPRTHNVAYMSRNLQNARDYGNFPRQVPPPNANFLAGQDHRKPRDMEHSARHYHHAHHPHHHQKPRQPQRALPHYYPQAEQSRGRQESREPRHPHDQHRIQGFLQPIAPPRGDGRSGGRPIPHERGRSAPPLFLGSPWDAEQGVSSTLFPPSNRTGRDRSTTWKALPAPPSQFRLGSDGMPWSAWAGPDGVPVGNDDEGDDGAPFDEQGQLPFLNRPTTVPLSSERQPDVEDPSKVQELETLSTAMMTVDNGFENQWWYQGPREPTEYWPREGEPSEQQPPSPPQAQPSRSSMPETMLVSALENTLSSRPDWLDDRSDDMRILVSPISETSSPPQSFRPLHRRLTARSDELFMDS